MHYYEVAPLQIFRAGNNFLTYSSVTPLKIGHVVRISLGKKTVTGIVMQLSSQPEYAVKEITEPIVPQPLPSPYLRLAEWLSEYYVTPLASVLQTMLPRGIEKSRRTRPVSHHNSRRDRTHFLLNEDQQAAITAIERSTYTTSLLHGVTGAGKTAVYIELAKHVIKQKKSVIILVPEIALTSQLIDDFTHHFSSIVVTHSKQTEAERHLAWMNALSTSQPTVVIGPRSALFLPLESIGLVVIDEAHEPSYKQEQSPRYSALRAAHVLAKHHKAKLVLGTATPLVHDYQLASAHDAIITIPKPARRDTVKPEISLVDMTKRSSFTRHRFLSNRLLQQLEADQANGNQSLIFHNRRGSASVTLCENCGWQAGCPRCFIPLTLHADRHELLCHICGIKSAVPTSCPQCHSANIIHKGIGTKLVESELRKIFPKVTIARFDGDTTSDDTVEQRYKELYRGDIDIIIGTQVIAKGLDLPHLRTVGIVQADAGLSLPDYSSAERTFQLLAQVVGRVGRSHHPTTVVVQSYQPNHPIVTAGLAQDYQAFYHTTLAQRKAGGFPPYTFLLKLLCIYKTEKAAIHNSQKLASTLRSVLPSNVTILGPTPAFYERSGQTYRWQLVLKSPQRSALVDALQYLPAQHWQYELDPVSLL